MKKVLSISFVLLVSFILGGCSGSEEVLYTLTFDTAGGTAVSSITQEFDSEISPPVEPQREGYRFTGWSPRLPSRMPSENINLVAQWSIIQYIITFDSSGGSAISPITTNFASNLNVEEPTKQGHTFIGWSPELPSRMPSENLTVTAQWEINQYTIKYNLYDNFDPTNEIPLEFGDTILYLSLGIVRSGALTSTGRVFMWGYNQTGQLGDGTTINRSTPTEITSQFDLSEGEKIVTLSLGGSHSSAVTSTGRVFMWGYGSFGQLGNGKRINLRDPIEITSQFELIEGEVILSVSLGGRHSSAVTTNGRIFMWGSNDKGQLGNGTEIDSNTPVEISPQFYLSEGEKIESVSLGNNHSSSVTSTGRLFMWGSNDKGQLGDGTTTDRIIPTEITSQFDLSEGETILSVSLGVLYSSAVTSTGRVFMWGSNNSGQLGDGTTTDRIIPTEITSQFEFNEGEKIVTLSLGGSHSSAVTSTSRVFMWGSNYNGLLGDGTRTDKSIPTEITSQFESNEGEKIVTLSLGGSHSSAVTSTGRVFMWGSNDFSQLGENTRSWRTLPTEILFKSALTTVINSHIFNDLLEKTNPTREGHTFDGWYVDSSFTTKYNFTSMPAENLNLYGRWIPNE